MHHLRHRILFWQMLLKLQTPSLTQLLPDYPTNWKPTTFLSLKRISRHNRWRCYRCHWPCQRQRCSVSLVRDVEADVQFEFIDQQHHDARAILRMIMILIAKTLTWRENPNDVSRIMNHEDFDNDSNLQLLSLTQPQCMLQIFQLIWVWTIKRVKWFGQFPNQFAKSLTLSPTAWEHHNSYWLFSGSWMWRLYCDCS
jgi:hypothetical protein